MPDAATGPPLSDSPGGDGPTVASRLREAVPACLGQQQLVYLPLSGGRQWAALLFLPRTYDADKRKRWPLAFFLHGGPQCAGPPAHVPPERVADVGLAHALPFPGRLPPLPVHDPPQGLERPPQSLRPPGELGPDFGMVVVSPQCPDGYPFRWHVRELDEIADGVSVAMRVDPVRTYLTGFSRGGQGTWEWASASARRFAAVVPVCGCWWCLPMEETRRAAAEALKRHGVAVWAFTAADDRVVPAVHTRELVALLREVGCAEVRFTELESGGHFVDMQVYADESGELYQWLLGRARPEAPAAPSAAERELAPWELFPRGKPQP
eukprot:TRINITY_DN36620_c0_g1_i2.p1 TRINITY_DN36620_c0_g1~~TRINITY_DN36620_c0_g1_i2.p1  ORF type:complete len:360 (+),score=76.47 TRINITY_DN36620_c0_g1_i2:114-1082(+)